MIDTILFDLDGTLLPLDMEKFMKIYFDEMGKAFHDIIEPRILVEHIWTATEAMIANVEDKSNEEVFMETFGKLIDGDLEIYKKRFDAFYDDAFLKVKDSVEDMPIIKESVAVLKKKGYLLVIATNPLFPQKAIYHRIKWAGFNIEDFSYISCYEKNHFCKPQLEFYREVMRDIDKEPNQCMMVGNDVQEDMIAGTLGMKTFLITDYMIHRTQDDIESTYQGTYRDFHQFVEQLEPVKGK